MHTLSPILITDQRQLWTDAHWCRARLPPLSQRGQHMALLQLQELRRSRGELCPSLHLVTTSQPLYNLSYRVLYVFIFPNNTHTGRRLLLCLFLCLLWEARSRSSCLMIINVLISEKWGNGEPSSMLSYPPPSPRISTLPWPSITPRSLTLPKHLTTPRSLTWQWQNVQNVWPLINTRNGELVQGKDFTDSGSRSKTTFAGSVIMLCNTST